MAVARVELIANTWTDLSAYGEHFTIRAEGQSVQVVLSETTPTTFTNEIMAGYAAEIACEAPGIPWARCLVGCYVQIDSDQVVWIGDHPTVLPQNGPYVPVVTSVAALRLLSTDAGAVFLSDATHNSLLVYDVTVSTAVCAADENEVNVIAHVVGEPGAWVNPYADPRRSQWSDVGSPSGLFGRFKSGIRAGDSFEHAGRLSGNTGTNGWLGSVVGSAGISGTTLSYAEDTACIVGTRSAGGIGVSGAARVQSAQNGSPIGVMGVTYNNSTNTAAGGWAGYFEGVMGINGAGNVRAAEFCVINENASETLTEVRPYGPFPTKMLYCVGMKAGDTVTGEVHHLFHFSGGSGGKALVGFLMRDGAIKREAGSPTGFAKLFTIPANYGIAQYGSSDGLEAVRFNLGVTDQDYGQNLSVTDGGLTHQTRAGANLFRSLFVDSPTSWLEVEASTTGAPILRAQGVGTADRDVYLVPDEAGRHRLGYAAGSYSGFTAADVTRIFEIKDGAGNTIQLFGRVKP